MVKVADEFRDNARRFLKADVTWEDDASDASDASASVGVISFLQAFRADTNAIFLAGTSREIFSAGLERTTKLGDACNALLRVAAQDTELSSVFGAPKHADMAIIRDIPRIIQDIVAMYDESPLRTYPEIGNKIIAIHAQIFGRPRPAPERP